MIRDISAGAFYTYSYTGKISVFTWMHLSTILWVRPSDFFLALLILVKNKNKKKSNMWKPTNIVFPLSHSLYDSSPENKTQTMVSLLPYTV